MAVMEPFISLGLKEGAHLVDVTFYRGAEVIAPGLSAEQRNAYLGAIDEAADRIMADFGRYKHYVTEQTRGRLAPHEMSDHFVRYTHYVVYDQKRFDQVYEWMRPGASPRARPTTPRSSRLSKKGSKKGSEQFSCNTFAASRHEKCYRKIALTPFCSQSAFRFAFLTTSPHFAISCLM